MRQLVESLEQVLKKCGEAHYAQMVHDALEGREDDLQAFLVSDELWGGPGSIADQAGVRQGRDVRRPIEAALITLGIQQIRLGVANERTQMWVDAMAKCQREGS